MIVLKLLNEHTIIDAQRVYIEIVLMKIISITLFLKSKKMGGIFLNVK